MPYIRRAASGARNLPIRIAARAKKRSNVNPPKSRGARTGGAALGAAQTRRPPAVLPGSPPQVFSTGGGGRQRGAAPARQVRRRVRVRLQTPRGLARAEA